jgi:hypothetical protein
MLERGKCAVTLRPLEDGIRIDYFGLVPVAAGRAAD